MENATPLILTIDDEISIRQSIQFFLEDLGYRVIEADSGTKGLPLAVTEQPDLILLDLRMPEIDGLQTLSLLKKELPSIPVIVISGTCDIRDAVAALRGGAFDFLTKPFTDMAVLQHTIENALERARLKRENLVYQTTLEQEVKKRTQDLVQAYQNLSTTKKTFEALFQAVPLAVILLDARQQISLWNLGAEKLFGWPAYTEDQSFSPHLEELDTEIRAAINIQDLNGQELVLNQRPGQKLTVSISTALLDNSKPATSGLVVILENITEKKRLQNEAARANRLASLGELAAGVAHEINNPNGLVLLNMPTISDTLLESLQELEKQNPSLRVGGFEIGRAREIMPQLTEETKDAALRIRQIVEDLKDFAHRDSSDNLITFDLNQSVEKALRLANNTIKKSTDFFQYDLSDQLPPVRGNPQRIVQVIVNLLVNACESLPDRSAELSLKTTNNQNTQQITLQVADQGIGIKAEDLQHVTDPFFTTRRKSGGTGLGLSVSARIVREHNGTLSIDSQPGKGTCVTVSLPYQRESA